MINTPVLFSKANKGTFYFPCIEDPVSLATYWSAYILLYCMFNMKK